VYGGLWINCAGNDVKPAPASFLVYSTAYNNWTTVVPLNAGPGKLIGHQMVLVGSKIFFFGGLNAFFQTKNWIWSYDIVYNNWTMIQPHDASIGFYPMFNFAALYSDYLDAILIFNGDLGPLDTSNKPLTALYKFNVYTYQFTLLSANATPDSTQISYGAYKHIVMRFGGDDPNSPRCNNAYGEGDNTESDMYVYNLRDNLHNGVFRQVLYDESSIHPVKGSAFATVGKTFYNLAGHSFVECSSEGSTDGSGVSYDDLHTFPMNKLLDSSSRSRLFNFSKHHGCAKRIKDASDNFASWCGDTEDGCTRPDDD